MLEMTRYAFSWSHLFISYCLLQFGRDCRRYFWIRFASCTFLLWYSPARVFLNSLVDVLVAAECQLKGQAALGADPYHLILVHNNCIELIFTVDIFTDLNLLLYKASPLSFYPGFSCEPALQFCPLLHDFLSIGQKRAWPSPDEMTFICHSVAIMILDYLQIHCIMHWITYKSGLKVNIV